MLVLFAHGSGSSRHSPRNRYVASVLHQAGVGTLLFDLLTPKESLDRANVFDIDLLARRLLDATRWVRTQPEVDRAADRLLRGEHRRRSCPVGGCGARSRHRGSGVAGGRPDLAAEWLEKVAAPTLLIVGSRDERVCSCSTAAHRLGWVVRRR